MPCVGVCTCAGSRKKAWFMPPRRWLLVVESRNGTNIIPPPEFPLGWSHPGKSQTWKINNLPFITPPPCLPGAMPGEQVFVAVCGFMHELLNRTSSPFVSGQKFLGRNINPPHSIRRQQTHSHRTTRTTRGNGVFVLLWSVSAGTASQLCDCLRAWSHFAVAN